MDHTDEKDAARTPARRALLLLLAGVSAAFFWILLPFYGAILWGAIIALLFAPVNRRLVRLLGGRPNSAALLTLLIVLVVVVLPFVFLTGALTREAAGLYQRIHTRELDPELFLHTAFDTLPVWVTTLLDRVGLVDFATLQRRLAALLTQASQFVASQALGIGQNALGFVLRMFIALYLAFFLIRDGAGVARAVLRAIPLRPADKQELLEKFTTVIRATVRGNVLVAALQGALGGLAFWYLDIRGALLWAVLMAVLSLLPAVGAGLVWLPVAVYFLLAGSVGQAVALTAYGVFVIGLIDNLLRPMLVGKDTGMPDYLVLVTTLGGIAAFGINGFVLGPSIAAMFLAVWHIYGKPENEAAPEGIKID
jgi:predicted PurR-regulated permease PerM